LAWWRNVSRRTRSEDDARERWIEAAAADLRAALGNPAVRADLAALLVGDPQDVKRRRRLADLQEELSGFDLTWQRTERDTDG
jgi:hypothetical protein